MGRILKNTWALFTGIGIILLANGLQGNLMGVRSVIENFSSLSTGIIMSGYFVGYFVGSNLTPNLVSRVGHIRVFAAFASTASLSILIIAAYVNPIVWTLGRFLTGLSLVSCYVVAESWLNDRANNRTRGKLLSVYMIINYFALACGALLLNFDDPTSFKPFILVSILLSIALVAVAAVAFIVWVERGQRRVTVNYARRQQGRKMVQGQTSYLPMKLNQAGVIPAIFASSILLFPASASTWFGQGQGLEWLQEIALALGPGQPLYVILFSALIAFFCFFYTALQFDSKDISENLRRSGAYLPGIRPGEQTADYIDQVMTKLTVWGSGYLILVCLMPQFLIVSANVPFYLGGTSLLIAVVVVMDFMAQVQSHLMSQQYESLLKKANLKGYGNNPLSGR